MEFSNEKSTSPEMMNLSYSNNNLANTDQVTKKRKINDEQNYSSITPNITPASSTIYNSGRTCLVCRKRKIKCDKTKPVCMKCIKHNSTMDCVYDDQTKNVGKRRKSLSSKKEKLSNNKNNVTSNDNNDNISKSENSVQAIRNHLHSFLDSKTTASQNGSMDKQSPPKKRGRPSLKKPTIEEPPVQKTPLISLPGINNELKTIYLTDSTDIANKQMISKLGMDYIPPTMSSMQQKIYKRKYSKIYLNEEKEEILKQNNQLSQIFLDQQNEINSRDATEMIFNIQRDKPGKISGKFADLSIIVQKRIKRQRLLKELSTLKKQLESMESLIDGSIQEEEMDLEELEMKFDRFNPRGYDSSNPTSPLNSVNDPSYLIFNNISKMSFYDGFEQVSVFNARLHFTAPLSAQVVLRKDPFGKVVSVMVEKTLHEYAKTLEVKKSSEKYDALRVTDSNSLPNLISTANSSTRIKRKNSSSGSLNLKKNVNNLSSQNIDSKRTNSSQKEIDSSLKQTNDSNVHKNGDTSVTKKVDLQYVINQERLEEAEEEVGDNDDDDDDNDDDDESNDSHEDDANEMFNKQFLENEGIDEMRAIIKEGKVAYTEPTTTSTVKSRKHKNSSRLKNDQQKSTNNKFLTSNLRSEIKPKIKPKVDNKIETSQEAPDLAKNNTISKSNLKPENDPAFWSSLNKVLKNIDTKENSTVNNSNIDRVPEGLFGSETSLEHELILQIQDILPPGKVINIYCKNYFKSPIHGLYPIINEDWWMDTMHRLLGFSESQLNSDLPPKVNITRRFDIAKLASLLVILRLSYFTYPDTLEECTTDEERFVLKYPIGKNFIALAQRSLNIFKLLRKGILPVLHCSLLLRVYRKYAPEEGDIVEGSDSETFTGFLVKISTSIGLNTDVARSAWVKDQRMYVDQWRKCWYCVYFFDFMEVCNMGNTSSIDIDSFDTKLPDFKLDPLTGAYPNYVIDSRLEDIVVNNYQKNFETTLIGRELISCITNKRLRFSVPHLQMLLNNLNGSIVKNFGESLKQIVDLECSNNLADYVFKLNNFIWFVELKALQFYCYIHIFIHIDEQINTNIDTIINQGQLEEKIELFHFYFKKIIEIYVEIEPVLILCYDPSKIDSIFGRGSKFIVIQSCENLIIRFIPGLHIIASRFLHFKFNYLDVSSTTDSEVSKMIGEIINCLMDKLSHSGGICRLLSKKYFQMWRISQANQFIFYLLNKQSEDNLFKKDSKINNTHREEWHYHNGNTFEDFFPFRNIPMYNLLTGYQLNHFQEVFSILNSVKWNIFSDYYTESELKQGINFRDKQYETAFQKFLKKNGNGHKKGRKNAKSKAPNVNRNTPDPVDSFSDDLSNNNKHESATPLDETHQNKNSFNYSRDSTSASNSIDSSVHQQNNIMMDDIDKYWYENYLSSNNDMSFVNQQQQTYQNLDDLFNDTNPENNVINNQMGETDLLKHQVIEKLAILVPEEQSNKNNQKQADSNHTGNAEANSALQSFLFNGGNSYYSDEINF